MPDANLTRFGPQVVAARARLQASFRALPGRATLVLTGQVDGTITLNGQVIATDRTPDESGRAEISLTLERENQIDVDAESEIELRITQVASADLGIVRQGYFGLNTSDIERQRALYETLGFIGEIYPAGPETSTSFARALGFEDDYLIHVSLHSLEDPPTMPFVDTVQFRGDSYRDEPPYARLNHIGMTYATYSTADLDAAYAYLGEAGVAFVAPPAVAPDGERFTFMKDQDGAFIKLIDDPTGKPTGTGAGLLRLVNTNMNVRDLERSVAFYRLLGFTESQPRSQTGGGEFAAAHGFAEEIAFDGVDVSLGPDTDGATLQLRQWRSHYDDEAPYPPPVNHLGIDRINFYVKDLTAAVATMNDLGFEQLGPIGGMPEVGIVFFFDPDGIKVQIAGPQRAAS